MPIGRQLTIISVAATAMIAAIATLRLAAVTLSTPITVWTEVYPRLLDPALEVDLRTQQPAETLSSRISDASLIHATQPVCFGGSKSASASDRAACLAELDKALLASPSSGELWLFKASTLAAGGN